MIYLHFRPQHLQSSVTSLVDTSAPILSKSRTSVNGGMNGGLHIRVSIVWPLIILQFQVRFFLVFNSFYLLTSELATSVDVERVFSQGRIVLSHIRNRLSFQSTRALMCVGIWSRLGYVKDNDIRAVVVRPEVPADSKEEDLAVGWDLI
jgi:hypothetical protein